MDQPHPYQIGQAIDAICDHAERMKAEIAVWKHDVKQLEEQIKAKARSDRSEIDRELDACVERSARDWRPLPGDPDEPGNANRLRTETDDQAGDTA